MSEFVCEMHHLLVDHQLLQRPIKGHDWIWLTYCSTYIREVANKFKWPKTTIDAHLEQFSYIKKLDTWTAHIHIRSTLEKEQAPTEIKKVVYRYNYVQLKKHGLRVMIYLITHYAYLVAQQKRLKIIDYLVVAVTPDMEPCSSPDTAP